MLEGDACDGEAYLQSNCVIVISSFQGSSASPPTPTPTKIIAAVLCSSLPEVPFCHGRWDTEMPVDQPPTDAPQWKCRASTHTPPPPPRDIPLGCCFFTGPWTVTRSSLRMLRWVAAFCRPLRPVLLLVSFPRS